MEFSSSKLQGEFFILEASRAFSFLLTDCNFNPPTIRYRHEKMSSDFTELRYESQAIFIEFFFAHMESELSLRIGLLQEKHDYEEYRQGLELNEALSFSGKCIPPINLYSLRSELALISAINSLASIVQNCLIEALCNPKILSQWVESRRLLANETKMKEAWLQKRKEAQEAWQKKDFKRVVSIYESFLNYLGTVEQKRLSYAKKHL